MAVVQTRALPSLLQQTHPMPNSALPTSSTDEPVTSAVTAMTNNPENSTTHMLKTSTTLGMTNSTPSTIPVTTHTLVTTQATTNNSHPAAPVTEATIGPSLATHAQPPTTTPCGNTTGRDPSTVSRTTGKTTQHRKQTTILTTLATEPHGNTTSQMSVQTSHTPGTASHNATQTISPASILTGPTLAPRPTSAKTGTYQVLNGSKLCIKAEMGLQLVVQDKEAVFSPQRYFNIDPNTTQVSGNCGCRKSNLFLHFQGGLVNFTFTKGEKSYYISEVGAFLTVSNPEKTYKGMEKAVIVFETLVGHSFKCVSEQSLQLSPLLQLKTTNVQLQAFDFEGDHFGNVDECFSDRSKKEIPVAVGLSITALLVVWLTSCLVARKRPRRGYERM
ncbi:lysosome-associated membrane glycoprotein 3 isoform X1 [Ochotona curzoniae]|uniref:lysosome-associated membrane glycoprotein 3 isoform X1 n=1 Tax=Ochotona curzoniae TaxID=130825 RepID=UPI001B34A0E4|nr:lysosome-associated membrane glycoprotein 3 isoform X1 [Ochotona curzoniae]